MSNFKVKCVSNCPGFTTAGKIYNVVDGVFTYDNGNIEHHKYDSVEEMNSRFLSRFELVKENHVIVIYPKGNEVIATIKEGKKVVKSAKATYNTNDALEGKLFDFEVGAKIAFNRLIETDYKKANPIFFDELHEYKPFKKAKVGDKIKVVKDHETHKNQMPPVKVGNTYKVKSVSASGIYTESCNVIWDVREEYIIIKEAKPEIKRVSRKAKVGEWIELTDRKYTFDKSGDVLPVYRDGGHYVSVLGKNYPRETGYDKAAWSYTPDEYIVLENYKES